MTLEPREKYETNPISHNYLVINCLRLDSGAAVGLVRADHLYSRPSPKMWRPAATKELEYMCVDRLRFLPCKLGVLI